MKYKDLMPEKLVQKLIATSFESPSKNREVYQWCSKVLAHIHFLENERIKLVQKYGKDDGQGNYTVTPENQKTFYEKFREILELDIDEKIDNCPVKQSWFDDDKCSYPIDKGLWITPKEIGLFEE